MSQIAVAAYVMKDALLQIATDNYELHVSSAVFEPDAKLQTWQAIAPAGSFSDMSSPTWSLKLAYAQDWKTTNSLAQYLLANQGQQKVVVLRPKGTTAGEAIITATVIIAPGPIGGDVNTVQTGEVTLGVVGVPVKSANP